jgi:hypothetical protein
MSEETQEHLSQSLMEAFIDAYLKRNPEETREQALRWIRELQN